MWHQKIEMQSSYTYLLELNSVATFDLVYKNKTRCVHKLELRHIFPKISSICSSQMIINFD